MTGRRPLLASVAVFAVPLPACLHISTPTAPATPITTPEQAAKITADAKAKLVPLPPKMEFATLPKVPGTVVTTKQPAPPAPPNTVTQKPPPAPPVAAAVPKPPVQTAGAEPGTLPFAHAAATLPEAPLLAAVRAYTEGRPERAIEIIRTLDKPNQDLVLALLPILARGASADLTNDPATAAALVEQMRAAAARLEPRAALRVEKAVFCKHVDGFGRYAPWPDNQPYRPHEKVQLYLEVRNLCQPIGNEYVTHVHAAVEVRDAHGRVVEQIDPIDYHKRVPVVRSEKKLTSQSPLHDFHVLYIFSAPPTPGVYTITVELRDAAGRRTVTTPPAQFHVAGP